MRQSSDLRTWKLGSPLSKSLSESLRVKERTKEKARTEKVRKAKANRHLRLDPEEGEESQSQ
jgi:hypothetical protein